MNALTTRDISHSDLLRVMRESLYPGAKPESVELVLAYCKARGLDPMLKTVHIVPMWVKGADGEAGMRDVPLPGIALYRIQAARSGQYGGKSEPEFGPDVTRNLGGRTVTFPAWCRVTVRRGAAEFTAKEFWLENYATAKKDSEAPNAMWAKRPYGQLAKVAEAQALRMAFPELTGGEVTGEEMEGKAEPPAMPPARGPVVDAEPQRAEPPQPEKFPILTPDGELKAVAPGRWLEAAGRALAKLEDTGAAFKWVQEMRPLVASIAEAGGPHWSLEFERLVTERLEPEAAEDADASGGF